MRDQNGREGRERDRVREKNEGEKENKQQEWEMGGKNSEMSFFTGSFFSTKKCYQTLHININLFCFEIYYNFQLFFFFFFTCHVDIFNYLFTYLC